MATRFGYEVTAGAWIDGRLERDDEIYNLIENANRYPATIKRVIVGNETLYRTTDLSAQEVISYIDRVRAAVRCPVGTAKTLARVHQQSRAGQACRFHRHPRAAYWERVNFDSCLGWVLDRYKQVREAFPDKPVFLAEVGWPSNGENFGKAKPSRETEAKFLRRFLNLADRRGLDYCISGSLRQALRKSRTKASSGRFGGSMMWSAAPVSRSPDRSGTAPCGTTKSRPCSRGFCLSGCI